MMPPPPGFTGVWLPNTTGMFGPPAPGVPLASDIFGTGSRGGSGGLARLLSRGRRTSTFFSRSAKKKPRNLEEMLMMQGGGNEYEESAP